MILFVDLLFSTCILFDSDQKEFKKSVWAKKTPIKNTTKNIEYTFYLFLVFFQRERKSILFHDNLEDCTMEKYCSVSLTTKDVPVEMQAMATVENEICLFTKEVSPDLCKWVASMIRSNRQNKTVRSS